MTTDPRILKFAAVMTVAITAIGVGVVLSDTPAADVSPVFGRPAPEEAPVLADVVTGDGVFVVGRHMKRGTYRTAGGPRCTWARLIDLTGEPTSIFDRGTGPGRTTVDLVDGVIGFETYGCAEWVMVR